MRQEIRDLVAHCDLEERLPLVPASAKVRGLYFKNNLTMLKREGLEEKFREYFPEKYSAVRWYAVSDYLQHLAVAGAVLCGPENVHEGMERIGHNNAIAFADSILGKAMIRLLARDPVKILRQGGAARRQSCTYGRWETEFIKPGEATVTMYEEYIWIESHLLGAAYGTFHSVNFDVEVEVELMTQFEGRLTLTWDPDSPHR